MRSPHEGLRKLRTDRTLRLCFADKGNPGGPNALLTAKQPATRSMNRRLEVVVLVALLVVVVVVEVDAFEVE